MKNRRGFDVPWLTTQNLPHAWMNLPLLSPLVLGEELASQN